MVAFRYQNVFIEQFGFVRPPNRITSAEIEDEIGEVYRRFGIPFGTLERLSGVSSRYMWDRSTLPSDVGVEAIQPALDTLPFSPDKVDLLINCSVSRDLFEPSTACIMHKKLGLPSRVMAFDVSNACIGFSNGLMIAANMIQSGAIRAAVVVSPEVPSLIIESNSKMLREEIGSLTREDLLKVVPVFTLGCGAVVFVMCHERYSRGDGHRFLGGAGLSATEHTDLCTGNGDFCVEGTLSENYVAPPLMHTESSKLIAAAAQVGGKTWPMASEILGWDRDDVDHVFCHQVGKQVNEAFYRELGLDHTKEFSIYKEYGNMISAALPAAVVMGAEAKSMQRGDKVVCTGFGSGLNSLFWGIEW
jgi:3-oxoacyl-[acyl-carrier-protein] synthase III